MPRVALHTVGCKLNFAETSTLGGQFMDRGFDVVPFGEDTDVVLINTCSVTARADRECRQLIRRALRRSPGAVVVVTGCYAQLAPEEVASINGVDFVLGTKEKFAPFDYVGVPAKQTTPRLFVSDIGDDRTFGAAMSGPATDRTRGFLKIQDGCDYHCTFCTIPRARGESRSQPIAACMAQAEALVRAGYKEIVLTGVNVGDYGRKLGTSLLELLRQLVTLDGLERVRLSSIEPNLLTPDLVETVASHPVLCKHFHVPLQSGSDAVLRRMRRRSTSETYAGVIRHVRERLPGAGIGADVIVGFPGETDSEFNETLTLLADLPVSYLHVFSYSERPHTPAAQSGPPVPYAVRTRRSEILRALGLRKRREFHSSLVGHTVSVLAEGTIEDGMRFGWTDAFVRVGIPAGMAEENTVVHVRINGSTDDFCVGMPEGREGLA